MFTSSHSMRNLTGPVTTKKGDDSLLKEVTILTYQMGFPKKMQFNGNEKTIDA